MGYTLEAILLDPAASHQTRTVQGVELLQGITLIPLTDDVVDGLPSSSGVASVEGSFWKLNAAIETLLQTLSRSGRVAYVEVDYFGGSGTQAAAVWHEGTVVFGPVCTEGRGAVNEALQFLGVVCGNALDEFDAVDLSNSGRNRSTEAWVKSQ